VIYPSNFGLYGLFNCGGIILYSYDLLFMMETLIKRGLPVSTGAGAISDNINDNLSYFDANPM